MNHICVAQGHHSCAVFNGALVAPDGTLGPVLELFGGQTCLEFSLQAAFFGNTFWGLGCLGRVKPVLRAGLQLFIFLQLATRLMPGSKG
ncbi:MAG: hypothetical protein DMG09_10865, partial [Acidobacteria bacterium]